jgi:DNA-binding transcriptional LysR family regulator
MEMRQLRYFVAVAEGLHFRRAGDRLHVTQPALSKQIRLLEEEIGTKLLARSNRHVALTPAGILFLDRAKGILQASAEAAVDAKKVTSGFAGVFSIGFVSTASFDYLPRLVSALRGSLPEVQIRLLEWPAAMQIAALERGEIDLGLLQASSLPPSLKFTEVAQENLHIALPHDHPLAKKRALDPRDIATEVLFVPQKEVSPALYEAIVGVFAAVGHMPGTVQAVEQVQTAICLTAAGLGVAVVPESARGFGAGRVVFKPLKAMSIKLQLLAAWRKVDQSPILLRAKQLLR